MKNSKEHLLAFFSKILLEKIKLEELLRFANCKRFWKKLMEIKLTDFFLPCFFFNFQKDTLQTKKVNL